MIAITGSAGKSTTTDMVYAVLKQKSKLVHTRGNLNTLAVVGRRSPVDLDCV
ncbi:Mur ligase family protein [Desmospora activa]|uniref:Mur ligase family protein n=1 Tax=Desmospora activa TaxID=500615 RepID=UPI001475786D